MRSHRPIEALILQAPVRPRIKISNFTASILRRNFRSENRCYVDLRIQQEITYDEIKKSF